MYECVGLNKKNLVYFKSLNERKNEFNSLNEDFFETYNNCNFAQQIFLRRRVKLLRINSKYIGYIWSNTNDKDICSINAINVLKVLGSIKIHMLYKLLIDTLKNKSVINYLCESNDYNYEILKNIGFNKKEGTLILYSNISKESLEYFDNGFEFQNLKIGKDEAKRCQIQNEIFKDDNRIPLNIEDIYFDQIQSYYFDRGSIFLKKDGEYIGYGQIIIEDRIPTIVNFGILKEYRGNGYSKVLLSHLLKIIKFNGFDIVKIKVKSTNVPAINLYEKLGFYKKNEVYMWELKR
ncbi:GNAT family N-acetyltransferase [Clostridium thailandense]|uniref:GNAT family N-acetyltransferase n=1 Tax=Clostridium thailandense TaxID=2794346 RepID=UPI00398956B2